jgi:pimeloyl-ACP methyl ester carboxylesterase
MKKGLMTVLTTLLIAGALVYGGIISYFYQKQDELIFPQRINTVNPSTVAGKSAEVTLPDGTVLHGVEVVQDGPISTLVLLFGGNAHDVGGFTNFWGTDVLQAGDETAVVGMAYRGYPTFLTPKSDGVPTEALLHSDAREIYAAYVAKLKPRRVVLVGYSLGTAIASRLAYELQRAGKPVANLVLVAPFTSMVEVGKTSYPYLPVKTLLKYPLDTVSFFGQLTVPTTILYTPTDGLLPPEQPFELQKLNPDVVLVKVENTDHGDILNRPEVPTHLRRAAGLPAL